MGQQPLYGHSGLGNLYNNYTWTMTVFQGQLYVGTMDSSYLVEAMLDTVELNDLPLPRPGADLYRFASSTQPAVPERLDGAGNETSYGIRTMATTDDRFYLGMANPMNLLADPAVDAPRGGWELVALAPAGSFPVPDAGPDEETGGTGDAITDVGPPEPSSTGGGSTSDGCSLQRSAGSSTAGALVALLVLIVLAARRRR